MSVILDASAVLAALHGEPGAELVRTELDEARWSVVNFAEVVAVLARDNDPLEAAKAVRALGVPLSSPDEDMAADAGMLGPLTRSAGLSLGDRFCLALARRAGLPVLTADRAWLAIAAAAGVEVRMIR